MRTHCIHVSCTFGADLHAQSVISNKNFCVRDQEEVYKECVAGWVLLELKTDKRKKLGISCKAMDPAKKKERESSKTLFNCTKRCFKFP